MTKTIVLMVDAVGLKILPFIVFTDQGIQINNKAIIRSTGVADFFRKYLWDASIAYGFIFYENEDNVNQCEPVHTIMLPGIMVSK